MTGKSKFAVGALAVTLLGALLSTPAQAQDGRVKILHAKDSAAAAVSTDDGGSGVTVVRGAAAFAPYKTVAAGPVTFIDGLKLRTDSLEPVSDWFLDRSGGQPVIVHCYTQQAVNFGDGRHIRCDARRL